MGVEPVRVTGGEQQFSSAVSFGQFACLSRCSDMFARRRGSEGVTLPGAALRRRDRFVAFEQ